LTYPILNKTIWQIFKYQEIAIFFEEYFNKNNSTIGWIKIFTKTILVIAFSFAMFDILYYISIYAAPKNSVFTAWDAVVSWDRWATNWYNNQLPNQTWHYPQLIPANWSLTYQFMGNSRIKFFAKDFMGFIEVYILLVIFILGIIRREVGYFFGVILTAWLQWMLGSRGNGYVDSSVAFFSLSAVACLLIAKNVHQNEGTYIYIGAVFAAGAAITKQAGLWIVLAYPFLLIFTNIKENRKHLYRYIPGILLIFLLVISPWYGYKEYQISIGKDNSEFIDITSLATQNRSWQQRLDHSLVLVLTSLSSQALIGRLIITSLCVLMLFAWENKFYQALLGFIIIPFTIFWALFFSYDTRNLNLAIPLIGLTAGIGLQNILHKIFNPWDSLKTTSLSDKPEMPVASYSLVKILKSIKVFYLIIPVIAIFLLPIRYPDSYMLSSSIAEQKKIGYPWLNKKIYEDQSEHSFNGKILTDYQYLGSLPELEQYYLFGLSNNPARFTKQINDTSVSYVLLNSVWAAPDVIEYIRQNIAKGSMQIIFEKDTFLFVTICHGLCSQ
jgi:hypothetical protein